MSSDLDFDLNLEGLDLEGLDLEGLEDEETPTEATPPKSESPVTTGAKRGRKPKEKTESSPVTETSMEVQQTLPLPTDKVEVTKEAPVGKKVKEPVVEETRVNYNGEFTSITLPFPTNLVGKLFAALGNLFDANH